MSVGHILADVDISIHAAREGGDQGVLLLMSSLVQFQSTPPVKAATLWKENERSVFGISIHAAREGGDVFVWWGVRKAYISIHAAREGGD